MELEQQESQGAGSTDLSTAASTITEAAKELAPEQPSGIDRLKAKASDAEKPKVDATKDVKTPPPGTVVKPAPGAEAGKADPAAPPAYTPDFKFKAQGKEFEVPEKFRALITDKASEEEVKTILGKAHTVDVYKGEIDTHKKAVSDLQQRDASWSAGANALRQDYQKGDFDSLFTKMNISPEKVYQWVLDKVEYQKLPPEQRAQLDAQRDLQRKNELAQENLTHASSREIELSAKVRGMELDQTLGKAEVKSMSDAFDARVGRPGAFRDALIEHGKSVWALSNGTVDLTPEQAVQSFVQKYGNPSAFTPQNPAAGAAVPGGNQPPPAAAASTPPVKVIPNVAGRSASPIKQGPKSIDDLRKLATAAQKEENAGRSPSQGYLAG